MDRQTLKINLLNQKRSDTILTELDCSLVHRFGTNNRKKKKIKRRKSLHK